MYLSKQNHGLFLLMYDPRIEYTRKQRGAVDEQGMYDTHADVLSLLDKAVQTARFQPMDISHELSGFCFLLRAGSGVRSQSTHSTPLPFNLNPRSLQDGLHGFLGELYFWFNSVDLCRRVRTVCTGISTDHEKPAFNVT